MNLLKAIVQRILLAVRDMSSPLFRAPEVSILCYHSIGSSESDTTISPEQFENQLARLQRSGVQFVSLKKIVEWIQRGAAPPRRVVAITFDDGYADFETVALPILEKYRAPATVFVVGDEVAARGYLGTGTPLLSAEVIDRLRAHSLIEIGYHSATHPNLTRLGSDELAGEVVRPSGVRYFAYPGGNHSPEAVQAVREAGYEAAVTIGWNLVQEDTNPLLLPRSVILKHMPLWRVRMATTRALSWYRLLARSRHT